MNIYERVGRRLTELFMDGMPPLSYGECPFCGFGCHRGDAPKQRRHDVFCPMPEAVQNMREVNARKERRPPR